MGTTGEVGPVVADGSVVAGDELDPPAGGRDPSAAAARPARAEAASSTSAPTSCIPVGHYLLGPC